MTFGQVLFSPDAFAVSLAAPWDWVEDLPILSGQSVELAI
jgi:hypothetical protein